MRATARPSSSRASSSAATGRASSSAWCPTACWPVLAELEAALAALEPVIGPAEDEPAPLDGGITNRNFRLRLGGRDVVVRLPGKDTDKLGIDRGAERAATDAAAAAGVGPQVV